MINGLDIYYSKKVGQGLKPVSNNNTINKKLKDLKPISNRKEDRVKNTMEKD